MRHLLLTLDTPAANLALDEALLDWAEEQGPDCELLRLWESPRPMVVLGRSSRVEQEVNAAYCAAHDIPVLRRSSGGAAIVAGPGCLMYAVVLSYELRPTLRGIPETHRYVLGRIAEGLSALQPTVEVVGTSDLAIADREVGSAAAALRKFSGNSLRAKRTHCLYHGTLLYQFDLPLIASCLTMPPRQPSYRASRPHTGFVANLPFSREALQDAILAAWPSSPAVEDWPQAVVERLVAERYGRDEWNLTYGPAKTS